MHFTKFISSVLFAVTAAASPLASGKIRRQATSDGQAGAYIEAPSGKTFTGASGAMAMPDLSNVNDGTTVSMWVGLDGIDTGANPNAIVIQVGVDATKKDGVVTYTGFYEWFPNPATFISSDDFTAKAGDVVTMEVLISEADDAYGVLVNENTKQTWQLHFYSPGEQYDARGSSAQWVIEQPPGLVLPNFGTVKFTKASAAGSDQAYTLTGGTPIDLVSNGQTLATGAINGDSEVDITYITQP